MLNSALSEKSAGIKYCFLNHHIYFRVEYITVAVTINETTRGLVRFG